MNWTGRGEGHGAEKKRSMMITAVLQAFMTMTMTNDVLFLILCVVSGLLLQLQLTTDTPSTRVWIVRLRCFKSKLNL
jgi:hypothetical protein